MTTLSSAGWIVHDIGLATTIGGTLFGQLAFEPSVREISRPIERDRVSEKAWNRFSWVNLASHAAFAVPWFIGREMLGGREVSARARALTRTKDVFVIASLVTGVSTFVVGKILGRKAKRGEGPEAARSERHESKALERTVAALGALNMLATTGVLAVTSLLAMEGSESLRFSLTSRRLP